LREDAIAFAILPWDFSENVIVTETSYKLSNARRFVILGSRVGVHLHATSFKKNFSGVKRENEAFQDVYIFRIHTQKNFKSNIVFMVNLILESKGLY